MMSKPTSSIPFAEFLAVAEASARAASAVALSGFGGLLDVRSKGGKDIVTQYDTAAEQAAIKTIQAKYADHAILAEESGAEASPGGLQADWLWIIDPIDGTHNYASHLPFWCCSVAVSRAETREVVAGAIFDPIHNELFTATLGGGAYVNGHPIHASDTNDLEQAFVATDIGHEAGTAERMLELAAWVQPQVQRLRLLGSSILAMAYVAAGRFDGYYHLSLQTWDIAAVSLLVKEAGGVMTDWDGQAIAPKRSGAVVSNSILHPQMLAMLTADESTR